MPPTHLVPRKSGAHRLAAIALYRALLTQSRAAPLAANQRNELQNLVRNRFKRSQHVHSIRRLKVSFEAGYEGLDCLDAAVAGEGESIAYLAQLLEKAPSQAKAAPPSPKKVVKTEKNGEPMTPKISLFDRPLPLSQLSGKRHVPVLFSANHIPVLRLEKPQPESLSRKIRQRIERRQKWHDQRHRLEDEREIARREDEWDRLVGEEYDIGESNDSVSMVDAMRAGALGGSVEPKWTDAVDEGLEAVQGKLREERERNRVVAEKMQAVVDRERELFEREKLERKEEKVRERLERKRLKEQGAVGHEHVHEQHEHLDGQVVAAAK
ncbi:hypothetical protein LTR37_016922 [Vermiconidia calcicola]|uniref:Uncharacterized protein n=1 Tax=Vermiconidia calcicola TaxID=1690605 RepID=A0ACC3MMY5_9PEZI|nr:hypothetical protein LTR37_016922 [Vermiconidia calcicola]